MNTVNTMNAPALVKFEEAVLSATQNQLVDAVLAFREVVDRWPDDELADDALYNLGACYLAMNQFARARDAFEQVITKYPNATIHAAAGRRESGRTAAKAWLGLVAGHLGEGDLAAAEAAGARLAEYSDSKVLPAPGLERTFHDIATSLLSAARAESEAETELLGPSDIVSDEA
jgi:tetratricopeptide (TPR) repeat protein